MWLVGHWVLWDMQSVHRKSHHREKRAFRGNICRLKDRRLSSFSLTSLKAYVREDMGNNRTMTPQSLSASFLMGL